MLKNTNASTLEVTCTDKCRLKEHGNCITSAITKPGITDYQLACYFYSICRNFAKVLDNEGRNALHMAASCGRRDLCSWLIKIGKADLNLKDQESGYTPLHRSIFYGHINNAVYLIELGAQIQMMDKDDLQAIDHAMKDRLIKDFSVHNPCQVYTWGTNNNYTLGSGNHDSRAQPELLDFFKKKNISIKQVGTNKFHSVFVSSSGHAWACGHGQGGRLGLDKEQTVITPQLIKTAAETVIFAAVGRNHTILLMESGMVWTCGSNTHHVLGHIPPPTALLTPRPIHPRLLKSAGGTITGVAAGRYHSVLWSESVILTFGLNGGQLGHPQLQDKTVVAPKQVTGLTLGQKYKIVDVATSVGAIVVCVSKGDIHLLHNYQIRRIASKVLCVTKVAVFGGELNSEMDEKLNHKGGEELKVMALTSTGKVMLWQESMPQITRCICPLKRSLSFCGMSLCVSSALLITKDGEAYVAHVKPKGKKKPVAPKSKSEDMSFHQFIEKIDCLHMSIRRVPHIHRAVSIAADPMGQNFIVIQENPKANLTDIPIIENSDFSQQMASLLENAHEEDSLHDIIFEVDKHSVAAHHFVLAQSSEFFANMTRSGSVKTLNMKHVNVQVLKQVLTFMYTYDCDIIHLGPLHYSSFQGDIIKAASDVAKYFKITTLMKCLQLLKFEDSVIKLKENAEYSTIKALIKQPRWERSMFPAFYDVSIASSDGRTFKAHKCLLAARLDYFNSMFTGGWVEAFSTSNLSLPIPQTVLCEILDFLYKDEAPLLAESQDVDYISSILVVSNQLFITHLKQICEVALSQNLNLRNAAYLLQLAVTYNADQLKNCSMQFISLNIGSVLESRSLEILDNKILAELSKYYRATIPAMCKRIITPFSTQCSEDEMVEIANSCAVKWLESEEHSDNEELIASKVNRSQPVMITGKKKTRYRKTSESQGKRFESVSSNSDLDCSIDPTTTEENSFEDLVERNQVNKVEEWIKMDKSQKTVLNRLKVIGTAPTVQPTPQDFIILGSDISPHQLGSPPLHDNKHFPDLSTLSKLSPSKSSLEIKRTPIVKLSQKQRKKLMTDESVKEKSQPVPVCSPWAPVNNIESSLKDIMKSTLATSPPKSDQGEGLIKFSDIMADEIQQRDNWCKMKSKSLQLTQIEDKAMEELRIFYNVANIFDEHITVERVLSANIAKPMWITSRHQ